MAYHRIALSALLLLMGVAINAGIAGVTRRGGAIASANSRPSEVSRRLQTDASAELRIVADEWIRELLVAQPLTGVFLGIPNTPNDSLGDNSLAATKVWQEKEDAWLVRIRKINVAGLPLADQVTYAVLLELLEGAIQTRVCRDELWPLNQQSGLQTSLPILSQLQPLGTESLRRDALARWHMMPRFIDTETESLRHGLRQGYTLPRSNVSAIIEQLDDLLKMSPSDSPLAGIAARDPAQGFGDAIRDIVGREIMPALGRYRNFLRNDYLPKARIETSISAIPNGEACYRARVRRYATLDMTPRDVHQLGVDQMAAIEEQMRALGPRTVGTDDIGTIVQRLRSEPKYRFRTREETIRVTEQAVERARAALPRILTRTPKTAFIVDPCEPFEEKSGCPGSYIAGDIEAKRPARFRLNAADLVRPRAEGVAFHEGIPGHHLQIALAQERDGGHPVTRYFPFSGFSEGWALYAERVADETGLYSSDLDRLGDLNEQGLRAARLVVDSGLHVLGWSRQRAIDYMSAHLAYPNEYIVSEVDRYIADPGQATAYMIGRLEIERLRKEATARRGSRFDLRDFHDHVLENGSVPLTFLRSQIERWLAQP